MSDLVKQLRDYRLNHSGIKHKFNLYDEAADRIEELKKTCKWCGTIHRAGENTLCPVTQKDKRIEELQRKYKALQAKILSTAEYFDANDSSVEANLLRELLEDDDANQA